VGPLLFGELFDGLTNALSAKRAGRGIAAPVAKPP
jgi:hypothetical protein